MKGSAHVSLGEGSGKNFGDVLTEKKVTFFIVEFKYGQTSKMWPSQLSLSLYTTFNPIQAYNVTSSKLQPCLLKQPLKTKKKVKRIKNYVLKYDRYLYFLI